MFRIGRMKWMGKHIPYARLATIDHMFRIVSITRMLPVDG